jgi:hypothetical protein
MKVLAFLIFVLLTMSHDCFYGDYDGFGYFSTAAWFDVLIIISLTPIKTKFSFDLQLLSVLSIFMNFCGWLLWQGYYEPTAYMSSYVVFYIYAIYLFVRNDNGRGQVVGWSNLFYFTRNVGSHSSGKGSV